MNQNKKPKLDRAALEKVSKVFSAFSDATRLAILQELMVGPRTVGELVEGVGGSQGNVSKQLQLLNDAGLLDRKKEGNRVTYSIADEMVFSMCELVCDKLNRESRAAQEFTFQI
ncbi:metalloregulator ArsR/SmtB family transcription factor [Verrucomicrobiales bacterium]|nr:metalloregulator ArsR/SmtB family transcription factor [Verrucomicrobiales bacterium]MDB4657762.1 metalloregulator ArsR/SmtB family transcription factor [Verrucomicrobiales bacterium]MDC0275668.1 metalloregulator ArsR/SmtB family transcription factor [Verrucomicrobiales bacterium]